VQGWLWAAVLALLAWAFQRLLSKTALADLGTRKFYLLSAAVSLLTYLPYLLLRPPTLAELPPAFGLACLMAVTFRGHDRGHPSRPARHRLTDTALSPALAI
jgi:hypothetical protein